MNQSTGTGRYMLNVPGNGSKPCFMEDPFCRLQKWGANLQTNSINLESDVTPTIQGRDFVIATLAAPTVMKEPEKPAEAEAAEGEGAEGTEAAAAEGGEKPAAEGDKKEGEDKKPAEEKK